MTTVTMGQLRRAAEMRNIGMTIPEMMESLDLDRETVVKMLPKLPSIAYEDGSLVMGTCDHDRTKPIKSESGVQVEECVACGARIHGAVNLPGSALSYLSPAGLAKLREENPDLYARLDSNRTHRAEVRSDIIDTMKAKLNGKAK